MQAIELRSGGVALNTNVQRLGICRLVEVERKSRSHDNRMIGSRANAVDDCAVRNWSMCTSRCKGFVACTGKSPTRVVKWSNALRVYAVSLTLEMLRMLSAFKQRTTQS